MINALTGLGYGIIGLAIVVGIGIVILAVMSSNVANCATGYVYNTNGSDTFTDNACCLTGGDDCSSAGNYTDASTATQTMNTLSGYLGTSSGGLATWIPIVIVLVIGMLFLGAFLGRKGRQS